MNKRHRIKCKKMEEDLELENIVLEDGAKEYKRKDGDNNSIEEEN